MIKFILAFTVALFSSINAGQTDPEPDMVIVTAADNKYFRHLLNLIGSLHYSNYNQLQEICVYDIGLTPEQEAQLRAIEKVSVHLIECTNPEMLKPLPVHPGGRTVPGLYSWKPLVIKDALDRFDAIMYLDAGTTVLHSLKPLFAHIRHKGYFFIAVPHSIAWCTTRFVIESLDLEKDNRRYVLDEQTRAIAAGIMGCSRAVYDDLIIPMCKLSKDIRYFTDDGSTRDGFGTGRHDQTLWSILVRLLHYNVNEYGWSDLQLPNSTMPFHYHWWPDNLNEQTTLYSSRYDLYLEHSAARLGLPPFTGHGTGKPYFVDYIHYKTSKEQI